MTHRTYAKIGFDSIEKLKEYGKAIGKDYTGPDNFEECYKFIFGKTVNSVILKRQPFFNSDNNSNPLWTFSYLLNIGTNLEHYKISKFQIPIVPLISSNMIDFDGAELKKRTILQITPIDNISNSIIHYSATMTIKSYYYNGDTLEVEIISISEGEEVWRNPISQASLTIFIYKNQIPLIDGVEIKSTIVSKK
jgi:hypothetical protein